MGCNVAPLSVHNSSITEYKNIEIVEIKDKEFEGLVLKMIDDLESI
jgi:hypothetical protein